jgi:hypothetical protein
MLTPATDSATAPTVPRPPEGPRRRRDTRWGPAAAERLAPAAAAANGLALERCLHGPRGSASRDDPVDATAVLQRAR